MRMMRVGLTDGARLALSHVPASRASFAVLSRCRDGLVADLIMDKCPRCGASAVFVGYEDARTFYQCEKCKRVWTSMVVEALTAGKRTPVRVLVADDSDLLVGLIASW